MKKIAILAAAIATLPSCSTAQITEGQPPSQKVGWNMPNATESITTIQDSTFLLEVLPEGASFQWRDRYDKHNEDPQDIIRIHSWLTDRGRGFEDIFVGTDSVGFDNAAAIAQLKEAGIPIACAEFVNEAFYPSGGYSFDWSKYEPKLLEFIAQVTAVDPKLQIGIPIAPKPSDLFTKEQGGSIWHKQWNDAAFAFMNTHPEWNLTKIIHIYYTGAFVPELGLTNTSDEGGDKARIKAPTRRVYDYRTDTLDEEYWRNIFYQSDATQFWEPMLNYLSSHAPGRPTRITECGYIAAGKLNGSWVFAAKAFELINQYGADPRHEGMNFHGGFTRSRVGTWGPRDPEDYRDPENPNNVSTPTADAFHLYFHAAGLIYEYQPEFQITAPGTYSMWFLNGGPEFTPQINTAAGLKYTYTVRCVTAHRFSSIGTTMDMTKRGSVLGPDEVSRIQERTTCPAISYGYIEVIVEPIIYGCTNPDALNYNPDADEELTPSSCFFQSDCACQDPTASNYNPDAPCQDNTDCTYPPQECFKKRWLFKGCKPDPSCRFNNCTPGTTTTRNRLFNQ